ncbi:hypothetical protein, partial [Actinobacillus pleuropneumoniae]|uniref:hypothetical protein n=1 Tax=Actinobacillus pleuropneumoniae TaxID=715 RepID=UPI0022793955
YIAFDEKSKNVKLSSWRSPNYKCAPSGTTRWAEKPVLKPKKNSKLTKFSPNSLKFGLEVYH